MKEFWGGFQKEAAKKKEERDLHYGKAMAVGGVLGGIHGHRRVKPYLRDQVGRQREIKQVMDVVNKKVKLVSPKMVAQAVDNLRKTAPRRLRIHGAVGGAAAGLGLAGMHDLSTEYRQKKSAGVIKEALYEDSDPVWDEDIHDKPKAQARQKYYPPPNYVSSTLGGAFMGGLAGHLAEGPMRRALYNSKGNEEISKALSFGNEKLRKHIRLKTIPNLREIHLPRVGRHALLAGTALGFAGAAKRHLDRKINE